VLPVPIHVDVAACASVVAPSVTMLVAADAAIRTARPQRTRRLWQDDDL